MRGVRTIIELCYQQRRNGPEGIELPHVAEIAEIGETQRFVCPGAQHEARFEAGRLTEVWPDASATDDQGRNGGGGG